ncbi:MAG: hypothetical protein ACREE9_14650 [Stellaceae bacterium]
MVLAGGPAIWTHGTEPLMEIRARLKDRLVVVGNGMAAMRTVASF